MAESAMAPAVAAIEIDMPEPASTEAAVATPHARNIPQLPEQSSTSPAIDVSAGYRTPVRAIGKYHTSSDDEHSAGRPAQQDFSLELPAHKKPHANVVRKIVVAVPPSSERTGSLDVCSCLRSCAACIPACRRRVFNRAFLATHFTYFRIHFLYFILLSLIGGAVIQAIEVRGGTPTSYLDAFFTATSACCVTGLITLDTSVLQLGSQIVIFLLMTAGSNVLMSTVPVVIRRYYYVHAAQAAIQDKAQQDAALAKRAEYRALGWVILIAWGYYIIPQVIVLIAWGVHLSAPAQAAILSTTTSNPWWVAVFLSTSAMNNAGFSLFADNLIQLHSDYALLLPMSVLILLGNIAYPVMFRVIVAALHKIWKSDDALKLLLDYPRRCFTHMFPAVTTRVLALVIAAFTLLQFALIMALDFDLPYLQPFPGHIRALICYFQSVSTRTAGFNVVDVSQISPTAQVVFALLMYVSAYPVLLSVRKSALDRSSPQRTAAENAGSSLDMIGINEGSVRGGSVNSLKGKLAINQLSQIGENEEHKGDSVDTSHTLPHTESFRSMELGIAEPVAPVVPRSYKDQMKVVASRDVLWLFLALVVVCIADNERLRSDENPRYMSVFGILFEIASAYGTVGLSLGYPGTVVSLSGQFSVVGKLVLIMVMWFGRHRGLPTSIDSAVYLPSILNANVQAEVPSDGLDLSKLSASLTTIGGIIRHRELPSFGVIRDSIANRGSAHPVTEVLSVDPSMFEGGAEMAISPGHMHD